MRPTFSIIFFTVMSGAGYGLWILIALGILFFWPDVYKGEGITLFLSPGLREFGLGAGFLMVSSGLLSSLGHLGQPRRAWRAFSQWRSSWLSREAIAAIFTFVPVAIAAAACIHDGWFLTPVEPMTWMDTPTLFASVVSILIGSFATVVCTANIYACVKPVRAWNNRFVVAAYLLLGIYSGGLFAWALSTLPEGKIQDLNILLIFLILAAGVGALLKFLYWRHVDSAGSLTTADAIGLGSLGNVRSFEQPHTEENYLTHEMGFRVARRHSRKLRMICLTAGFAIPAMIAAISLYWPVAGRIAAWLALFSGMLGIFVERWLFFAEAKHTVMLYYR
jgi:sulfite dehydrogenase (quinone) subunit SoeC